MYHLKISIPSFRQIQTVRSDKEKALKENQGGEHGNNASSSSSSASKGHFVYNIEVGFLGERSQDVQEQRMARFYFVERRYSAFLSLHNEVKWLWQISQIWSREFLILSATLILQLRKRYRLLSSCCEFPPKKIRNSTPKVLETRRVALEQYLQQIVKQSQRSSKPLPPPLLDFLQVSTHVPKISASAASPSVGVASEGLASGVGFESLSSSLVCSSTHKPLFGFVCKEPFLFESSQTAGSSLNVSLTGGLPDIVTTATLQYFYTWKPWHHGRWCLLYSGLPIAFVIVFANRWVFTSFTLKVNYICQNTS